MSSEPRPPLHIKELRQLAPEWSWVYGKGAFFWGTKGLRYVEVYGSPLFRGMRRYELTEDGVLWDFDEWLRTVA